MTNQEFDNMLERARLSSSDENLLEIVNNALKAVDSLADYEE